MQRERIQKFIYHKSRWHYALQKFIKCDGYSEEFTSSEKKENIRGDCKNYNEPIMTTTNAFLLRYISIEIMSILFKSALHLYSRNDLIYFHLTM